jgi:hypothetical protein
LTERAISVIGIPSFLLKITNLGPRLFNLLDQLMAYHPALFLNLFPKLEVMEKLDLILSLSRPLHLGDKLVFVSQKTLHRSEQPLIFIKFCAISSC